MTVLAPATAFGVSLCGAAARVSCEDAWVRGELEKDFAAHRAEPSGGVRIELRLVRAPGPVPPGPAWSWGGARFKDEGSLRRLDYGGGTAAAYDLSREAGAVWSPDRDFLRELGYLFLHSRLGWELDRRGLHRAHALGVEKDGRAGLLFLPSGGGKTSTALELLRRPGWRLLGDDHPLVDARSGEVLAFQGRPGLRAPAPAWGRASDRSEFRRRRHGMKPLLDLDVLAGRLASRGRLSWVAFGVPRASGRLTELASPAAAAALARRIVVGDGLPQVFELLWPGFRPAAWGRLAVVAADRAAAAARLAARARVWRLPMGGDAGAAADLVEEADRLSRA